ncbi:hypothetical protein [Streptomyces sp. NPDC002463]|uniref:hypothetical protein n=1 Tax=Streptomyces sp. NPDC002463 TaxID=3364645 RepID=UPI0036740F89
MRTLPDAIAVLPVDEESQNETYDRARLWMPPAPSARCRYATEWTGTKLCWGLSVDPAEVDAIQALAVECPARGPAVRPAEGLTSAQVAPRTCGDVEPAERAPVLPGP